MRIKKFNMLREWRKIYIWKLKGRSWTHLTFNTAVTAGDYSFGSSCVPELICDVQPVDIQWTWSKISHSVAQYQMELDSCNIQIDLRVQKLSPTVPNTSYVFRFIFCTLFTPLVSSHQAPFDLSNIVAYVNVRRKSFFPSLCTYSVTHCDTVSVVLMSLLLK